MTIWIPDLSSHRGPRYLAIAEALAGDIRNGALNPGDRLPTVRQVAVELSINPNTVIRAYRELEGEGVVDCRRGAGVFVAEGVSPLARREQNRILAERVDVLLTEARQMNVDIETLVALVRRRHQLLEGPKP